MNKLQKTTIITALSLALLVIVGAGCGSGASKTAGEKEAKATQEDQKLGASANVYPTVPISADSREKFVMLYAMVNRKYLKEPAKYLLSSKETDDYKDSLFVAATYPQNFHDGLMAIGAKNGKMPIDAAKGTKATGGKVKMFIRLPDSEKDLELSEVISVTPHQDLDLVFSGTMKASHSESNNSKFISLDSNPIAIVSNASLGRGEAGKIKVQGLDDKLPVGTGFAIIFVNEKDARKLAR